MSNLKISFCTVCMNRLHHLKETLLKNLIDNQYFDYVEFVVLDYNSSDHLDEFIKENFSVQLLNKKLFYYRTFEPEFFNRSHSRNLLFKLATGDILCNMDADNFIGNKLAPFIYRQFSSKGNMFLTALGGKNRHNASDTYGRVCIRKCDFLKVSGYDEKMSLYGFEDYDFVNRLTGSGLDKLPLPINYSKFISHSVKERLTNERIYKEIDQIYILYITPELSEIIFLFENSKCKLGTIKKVTKYSTRKILNSLEDDTIQDNRLTDEGWIDCQWKYTNDKLSIRKNGIPIRTLRRLVNTSLHLTCISNPSKFYYKITDINVRDRFLMLYSQLENKTVMENNIKNNLVRVNDQFGRGIVFKNFDISSPIIMR